MVLNGRRLAFVEAYAQGGKSMTEAAIAAGYSQRHARGRAYTLLQDPDVKAAVEEIQNKVKERAQYGLEEAVAEANELMTEAREKKQMTAAATMFATKMKLLGLLTDKLKVEADTDLSLVYAIEEGKRRVAAAEAARALPRPPVIDTTATDVTPQPDPRGDGDEA